MDDDVEVEEGVDEGVDEGEDEGVARPVAIDFSNPTPCTRADPKRDRKSDG